MQTVGLEGLRSPPQITTFIKQQQQVALRLTTGPDPEAGLISFCASMDGLLSIPGLRSDYIHFSAITTAAAHIWKGAQQSSRFRGHADVSVEGLYRRCLQSLQPLLADMGAQAISNVLWSSATLSFNPDDAVPGMVDTLTSRFLHLINVAEARQTPNAYDVANVLWALAQLKHAPSHAVVAAMFDRLVALCHIPGLQPNSQDISNSLVACAELRLVVRPTFVEALVKQFLGMHVSNASYQHYCNAAWGLAVKQCLDLNTFAALLDKVITKHNLFVDKSGPQSTSAQLAPAEVSQLYQAFAWLRPPSGSRQMQGWSNLQSRLLTVAPEPGASKVSLPGQTVMWAALAMQEVPYKAQVQRGVYCVHALLSPRDSGIAEVMLMVEGPGDHLVNLPSR